MRRSWRAALAAVAAFAVAVLDLVRLTARAHERGESGVLGALAFFFKDPLGAMDHTLAGQWRALARWCEQLGASA